jgi:hypothetical protein
MDSGTYETIIVAARGSADETHDLIFFHTMMKRIALPGAATMRWACYSILSHASAILAAFININSLGYILPLDIVSICSYIRSEKCCHPSGSPCLNS